MFIPVLLGKYPHYKFYYQLYYCYSILETFAYLKCVLAYYKASYLRYTVSGLGVRTKKLLFMNNFNKYNLENTLDIIFLDTVEHVISFR